MSEKRTPNKPTNKECPGGPKKTLVNINRITNMKPRRLFN